MLGKKTPARVGANSTALPIVVERTRSRRDRRATCWRCRAGQGNAREYAVTEIAQDTEDFVVAKAWLKYCLDDKIRGGVVGVIADRIEQAAGCPKTAEKEVVVCDGVDCDSARRRRASGRGLGDDRST